MRSNTGKWTPPLSPAEPSRHQLTFRRRFQQHITRERPFGIGIRDCGGAKALDDTRTSASSKGVCSCPLTDPHTQIAAGLEQLVILTRVTFDYRAGVPDQP